MVPPPFLGAYVRPATTGHASTDPRIPEEPPVLKAKSFEYVLKFLGVPGTFDIHGASRMDLNGDVRENLSSKDVLMIIVVIIYGAIIEP